MKVHPSNATLNTVARVEHINVPAGDGFIRWHTINLGSEADSSGAVKDADSGGSDHSDKGGFQQTLDQVKRVLSFWR